VKTGEMEELVQETLARDRLVAQLSAGLGVLALVLASVGLYGVMAYAVSARTAEIGVRMATGAQRSHIVRMVLKETLGIATLGVAIGLPLSLAANRLLEAQLFGVTPWDPVALTSATALMLGVAILAGYVPARRAALLDPVCALRSE
jgi:ABC-type antimicrobial peptide transport system permease subunit